MSPLVSQRTGAAAALGFQPRVRIAALALVLTFSCATPHTRPPRSPQSDPAQSDPAQSDPAQSDPAQSDPVVALANLRRREEGVRTMRARFQAQTLVNGERRSAAGVLLVRKPGWFRLRLFLPLGLSILDYLYRDGRSWRSMALHEVDTASTPREVPVFSWEDLSVAFLRGTYAFPGTCEPARLASGNFEVTCDGGNDGLRRWMEIAARDGTLIQEASYDLAGRRFVIRYLDYRRVDGLILPFRVMLDYPRRELALDIEIDRYEINPELPDRLFQPLQPDS